MNNSPFEIFRRNLKPLMVALTGLALFAFVVLPVLDTYMRQTVGTASDGVVASFGSTDLTRVRVDNFTQNHQATVRFLAELAQLTIARGGTPRTAGFQYDEANQQVRAIGINQDPSYDSTIRTIMLANEAQKAGFDLDDSSLQVWLESYTDGMVSGTDIDAMLMQSTQNRMGRPHLYEQLRNHLLANVYLTRGYSGLYLGDGPMSGPLMTPEEQWANFLKLNQNAVVTSYGVLVNDYLERTNKAPASDEIEAVYEEGKSRYSDSQSPEPGFRRRYVAKFEYLAGSLEKFLDEEVAKLSEEQIRAEYEKRLAGGEFRLPETEMKPETESTPEPGAESEGETPTDPSTSPAPSTETPATETPATETPATETPATETPATETPTSDPVETESPAAEGPGEGAQPEAEDQSSLTSTATRLVLAQQQDPATESAETVTAESDTQPPAGQEPATPASTPSNESPAETSAQEATSPGEAADAAAPAEPAADEAPKVESFEDVRQRIAEEMAAPAAADRLNAALTDAMDQMRLYFNKLAIYESNVSIGQAGDPPAKPGLKAIAEKYGLEYEVIGPYNAMNVDEEPIANSSELGSQFSGPGPNFAVMMYGFDNGQFQVPRQPLFSPIRTTDAPAGKQYVSWKIEETEAYIPTLEEVYEEVVMVIRTQEARKFAREAAEEIAKQLTGDKTLADVVPADRVDQIREGLGPFTWMNSFGFQGATIGNVPELDSVGDEFMKAVFTTETGGVAVAANQPQSVIYVVTPTRFEPALEELRRQFKQPTNRMMAMLLGNGTSKIISDFYENVDEQAGFVSYLDEDSP